ncbi:DivIVA domain-containing protein [Micromonospora sp. NBC_00617]|uniref:DivIVA domain-containing protein n=1 Tax=unclassified Micromonospora TaxID=2617518 RepID=UPI0030E46058|nr:DivIVA domain-containing protein [Micromonospora sp. NBC_01638]
MRLSFRRSGRPERTTHPSQPSYYRSATYLPLFPWQVRERRFRPIPFARRGLDPDEVYAFLDRVAGDLSALHAALGDSRQETARIKDALRQWQSDQVRPVNAGRYR